MWPWLLSGKPIVQYDIMNASICQDSPLQRGESHLPALSKKEGILSSCRVKIWQFIGQMLNLFHMSQLREQDLLRTQSIMCDFLQCCSVFWLFSCFFHFSGKVWTHWSSLVQQCTSDVTTEVHIQYMAVMCKFILHWIVIDFQISGRTVVSWIENRWSFLNQRMKI